MHTNTRRLLAALALAALVAGGAIALSSRGAATPTPAPQSTVLAGLPEHDGVLGDPGAPVTVTEFLDPQCPACAAASHELLPQLVELVRDGRIRLQARTLSFLGPDSVRAARFAWGAARQGKLWRFLEAFYARQGPENSGYVTDEFLRDTAAAAHVDADAAFAVADDPVSADRLAEADAEAARLGVTGTPTFVVQRGNGPQRIVDAGALLAELTR